jgi:ubiquinone/menaquinone biosynthesis C-methylase UbiE
MSDYSDFILRKIEKFYDTDNSELMKDKKKLDSIIIHDRKIQINKIHDTMVDILSKYKRKKVITISGKNEEVIRMLKSIKMYPKSVLDFGGGNGNMVLEIKKYYKIKDKDCTILDDKTDESINCNVLRSHELKKIESNSKDLILCFSVLHHIHPKVRRFIIQEFYRILKPNGIVLIREHNDDKTILFTNFLECIHEFWYFTENESRDEMFLMSKNETKMLFNVNKFNLFWYSEYKGKNLQNIYHAIYKK